MADPKKVYAVQENSPLFQQIVDYCVTQGKTLDQLPAIDVPRIFQATKFDAMGDKAKIAMGKDYDAIKAHVLSIQDQLPLSKNNAASILNGLMPLIAKSAQHINDELNKNPSWKTNVANVEQMQRDICLAYTFALVKMVGDDPSIAQKLVTRNGKEETVVNTDIKNLSTFLGLVTAIPENNYAQTLANLNGPKTVKALIVKAQTVHGSIENQLKKIGIETDRSRMHATFTEEMHHKNEAAQTERKRPEVASKEGKEYEEERKATVGRGLKR